MSRSRVPSSRAADYHESTSSRTEPRRISLWMRRALERSSRAWRATAILSCACVLFIVSSIIGITNLTNSLKSRTRLPSASWLSLTSTPNSAEATSKRTVPQRFSSATLKAVSARSIASCVQVDTALNRQSDEADVTSLERYSSSSSRDTSSLSISAFSAAAKCSSI
eukprot:scaffold6068_cov119-Isochrysis_galbana.AAC.31